jgi:hypothetical protein
MEFEATVLGQTYRFSLLNPTSVWISGKNVEYILYKTKEWRCADDISHHLLQQFGQVIEQQLQLAH